MELSINVGYFGPHISDDHDLIKKLDDMGFSCIWTAEAYGYDAVTPLSYFSALTKNINIFVKTSGSDPWNVKNTLCQ